MGIEYCGRCGTPVQESTRKIAASDSQLYCIRCAEEADRQYLAKNTCSVCSRLLKRGEHKFVMPSRLYAGESTPVLQRLACAECYGRIARSNTTRSLPSIGFIRNRLMKGRMARGFVAKAVIANA